MNFLAEEYMASWTKRGYFVVRGFAEPDEICDLRRSCDVVLKRDRFSYGNVFSSSVSTAS